MKATWGAMGFAVAMAVSASASATQWKIETAADLTTTLGGAIYCASGGTANCGTSTSGKGLDYITLKAYSTNDAVGTAWIQANMTIYTSSGIGISNTTQTVADSGSPQHAIDNNGGVWDILVVDFGSASATRAFDSLAMGWQCAVSPLQCNNASSFVDVDAFIGNTAVGAGTNFGTVTGGSLPGGFTEIAFSGDAGFASTSASTSRTDAAAAPNYVGQYLVIAAGLGTSNSAFKLDLVTTKTITTPPTGAPVPGSLPLLGLGLVALGFGRKRSA